MCTYSGEDGTLIQSNKIHREYLELDVALCAGHVEGALERGDAVSGAGPIPAAKLIALINLSHHIQRRYTSEGVER